MNFRIPKRLAEFMRVYAKRRDTTMTQLIIDYFTALKDQEENPKEPS